jgi:hypothetical protein
MDLVLVVSDCPSPPDPAEVKQELPLLPALSTVLARGEGEVWRASWQTRLAAGAFPPGMPNSIAAVAALTIPAIAGLPAWYAQPVHLFAAADHLRLPASGLLQLARAEADMLCADFARVFGTDGFALHVLPQGGLVLTGLVADVGAGEPARRLGERLDGSSRGVDVRLRRLASEIELWLHEHPLNLQRAQRGAASVSALWLWGGESLPTPASGSLALPGFARVFGTDPFVAGYATLLRVPAGGPPADFASLPSAKTDDSVLVQLSARQIGSDTATGLDAIDALWLAPALAAIRRGALRRLRLLVLDSSVELTRARSWRLWQRRAPWWETLRR